MNAERTAAALEAELTALIGGAAAGAEAPATENQRLAKLREANSKLLSVQPPLVALRSAACARPPSRAAALAPGQSLLPLIVTMHGLGRVPGWSLSGCIPPPPPPAHPRKPKPTAALSPVKEAVSSRATTASSSGGMHSTTLEAREAGVSPGLNGAASELYYRSSSGWGTTGGLENPRGIKKRAHRFNPSPTECTRHGGVGRPGLPPP